MSSVLAVDVSGEEMRTYIDKFDRCIRTTNSTRHMASVRAAWIALHPTLKYPAAIETSLKGAVGYVVGDSSMLYAVGYKIIPERQRARVTAN